MNWLFKLIQMSAQGAVLILVILLLRALLLYKLPKKTFVALWWVALARLLIPFELPSAFSVYSFIGLGLGRQASAAAQAGETLLPQSGAATQVGGTGAAQALIIISSLSAASGGTNQTAQAAAAAETAGRATASLPLWGIVWCVGLAVGLAAFAVCYARNLREFRTSLPVERAQVAAWQRRHPLRRRLQIRQSDRVAGPLTYGVLRPVILLPKDTEWEDERQTECVLLHEYEHIRHWDALAKLLMAVALCVHWFDPLVWVMWVLFNRDLELACDEAVLRRMGRDCRVQYATMLLDRMETQARYAAPLCSAFGSKAGSAEKERIVAIMKTKKSTVLAAVCAGLLVCAVAVGFATGAKPQQETETTESAQAQSVQIQTVAQKSGKITQIYTDEEYPSLIAQQKKRLELENTTGIDFSAMTLDEVRQALQAQMGKVENPFGSFNHSGTVYTSDSATWYSTLKPFVMYGLTVESGEQCRMEYQGKTVLALCDFAPTQYGHSSGVTRYAGVVTEATTEGVVLYVERDANGRCVGLREATEDELLMWVYMDAESVFYYTSGNSALLCTESAITNMITNTSSHTDWTNDAASLAASDAEQSEGERIHALPDAEFYAWMQQQITSRLAGEEPKDEINRLGTVGVLTTLDRAESVSQLALSLCTSPFGTPNDTRTVNLASNLGWDELLADYETFGLTYKPGALCTMEYGGRTVLSICDYQQDEDGSWYVVRYPGKVTAAQAANAVMLYVEYDENGQRIGLRQATDEERRLWYCIDSWQLLQTEQQLDAAGQA